MFIGHNLLQCKRNSTEDLDGTKWQQKQNKNLDFLNFIMYFFHVFMYFNSFKKVVNQIFKSNIVLYERYISKCPNVSGKKSTSDNC